jgi:NAD(P)-dependent dehydrogenase (short-subunit alcohol dehydrogenase family)
VTAAVRTRSGAEALAAAAEEGLGGVDILVHNVGGAQPHKGALAIPDEQWQDALNLNLLAAVRLDALLAPGMRERRSGAIVHISSAATPTVAPPFLHYTAAKAALENYSRGLALELAGFGVRVNSVSPGRTTTPYAASKAALRSLARSLAGPHGGTRARAAPATRTPVALAATLPDRPIALVHRRLRVGGRLCSPRAAAKGS